jgi:superfamily II DNA/RNA helicase
VIQYDAPKNIDVHTHRVGRTGRAGVAGRAYALVTGAGFASLLVSSMNQGKQMIPPDLSNLARRYKGKQQFSSNQYDDGGDEEEFEDGKNALGLNSGSDKATWKAAKRQHLQYSKGAGLGQVSNTGSIKRQKQAADDYSLGTAFADFKSSFHKAKNPDKAN